MRGPCHRTEVRWLVVAALGLLLSCANAQAQDADAGVPLTTLRHGLRLYLESRFVEALPYLELVAEGRTSDPPFGRQQGQLFLAKALYHLERYPESLAAFARITQRGPSHYAFGLALPWLVMLHPRVDASLEPTLIRCIARYDDSVAAQWDTPETREVRATAYYLLGRARYEQRRYDVALALFERVQARMEVSAAARRWAARTRAMLRRRPSSAPPSSGVVE